MKTTTHSTNTRTTILRFSEKEVAEILAMRSHGVSTVGDHMTVTLSTDSVGSPIGPRETEYVVMIVEDFDKLPRCA